MKRKRARQKIINNTKKQQQKEFLPSSQCNRARKHLACSNAIISIVFVACLPACLLICHQLIHCALCAHILEASLSHLLQIPSSYVSICERNVFALPFLLCHHLFSIIFRSLLHFFLVFFFPLLFDLVLAREQCIKCELRMLNEK